MDPNQFLGLISMATTRDEDRVRMGTIGVMADPPTKATVIFDGEGQATSKEYFFATEDSIQSGDRVLLTRAGHSWLIVGRVASASGHTRTLVVTEGRVEFPNDQSVLVFGTDSSVGGPLGFEFVGGEARFYYRTSPNQFSIETSTGQNVMDWDVDDLITRVHGEMIVHEISALSNNEVFFRSSIHPAPNVGEGAESTRPDSYPRGITVSPTVAAAQGWPLTTGSRGIVLTVHSGTGGFQLVSDSNGNNLFFRSRDHGSNSWYGWKTVV